ncbi:MAG: hypothetical protein K0R54_570 [Clostridiaceae bacterium]|jgi:hypothetical protein|nr:hypothetical protein [Clostridiaceae bacterium]
MKNKKIVFTVIILIILVSLLAIYLLKDSANKDKEINSAPIEEQLPNKEISNEDKPQELINLESKFEKINNLEYTILRNEIVDSKEANGKNLLFDILISNEMTDDQIITIGKEITKLAIENNNLVEVNFNVFTSEDSFKITLEDNYNFQPINGLEASFLLSRQNESNIVNFKKYMSYNIDTPYADLDYEFINAIKSEDGKHLETSMLITSSGTDADIWNMSNVFKDIIKDINVGAETLNINVFLNLADYQAHNVAYKYTNISPDFLTKQTLFTY